MPPPLFSLTLLTLTAKLNKLSANMSERSGWSKRKKKREKEEKNASMLRSLPSINTFFTRQNTSVVVEQDVRLQDQTVSQEARMDFNCSSPPPPPPEEPICSSLPSSDDNCSQPQPKTWMYTETDPAIWGTITEEARGVLIDRGLAAFQNRGKKYPASVRDGGLGGRVRSLTNDIFECALHNGEKVTRD
ncbi:unnamed protein product [Arctogadus glacialis]